LAKREYLLGAGKVCRALIAKVFCAAVGEKDFLKRAQPASYPESHWLEVDRRCHQESLVNQGFLLFFLKANMTLYR